MPNNTTEHDVAGVDDSAVKTFKQKVEVLEIETQVTEIAPKKEEKDPVKAYIFAFLTAILFSWSNYMMAFISHLEIKEIYPQWFDSFVFWVIYHAYHYFTREDKDKPYLRKETSAYYTKVQMVLPEPGTALGGDVEASANPNLQTSTASVSAEDQYRFDYKKLTVPILATVLTLAVQGLIAFTFYYAGKSDVNGGIIASIFSTSAIFSPIFFFFVHKQKLTFYDMGGCVAIVASVLVIGISGSKNNESETASSDLFISIALAVGVGFGMSMMSLFLQWAIVSAQYPPGQIFYDGNILYGIVMLWLYLREQAAHETFTLKYFVISNIQQLLAVLAVICLTYGVKYGKGGTVQAIEQTKSIFQACWAAIFLNQVPILPQWLGMLAGVCGICIIVLQPKKEDPPVENEQKEEVDDQQKK